MTYQTHDPYLRRDDPHLDQQQRGARFPTTRSNTGTAIGLAVALVLLIALGVMLSLGPDATTSPVNEPDAAATAPAVPDTAAPAADDPALSGAASE